MTRRPAAAALATLVISALLSVTGGASSASSASSASTATAAAAAPRPATGPYQGTVIEDGQASAQEWVRFKVKGTKVVRFRVRVWLHCYTYPNSYYQLPAVVTMPAAKIRKGRVSTAWTQQIPLEDTVETLHGQVELTFAKRGRVAGRLSVDVANCATRLGDAPPYWVDVRARRR